MRWFGRIMMKRAFGKLVFSQLQDESETIQHNVEHLKTSFSDHKDV